MKKSTSNSRVKKLIRATLLIFFVIILSGTLFWAYGIQINSLSVRGISIEKFSLRWDRQLILSAEQIAFDTDQNDSTTSLSSPLPLLQKINRYRTLFSSVKIGQLKIGSLKGKLYYSAANSIAQVDLSGEQLTITSSILFSDKNIEVSLPLFSHSQYGLNGSAKLSLTLADRTFRGNSKFTVADSVPVEIDFSGDEQKLSFKGKENGTIETIKPIIELFQLDAEVVPWITEYLAASRFRLESFSGTLPWQQPEKIFQNLEAKIKIDECQYTFAEDLEPIKTEYTRVNFTNGVLNIRPHKGTFYGQDTQSGWLKIDFNDTDNIILTAFITTEAVANKDIIRLLDFYEIWLPLEQLSGTTQSNLTLDINLNSSDVEISGDLKIGESVIEYEDKQYQVNHADLYLENSLVILKNSNLSYQGIYNVEVTGQYDGSQDTGLFSIQLKDFSYPVYQNRLSLEQTRPNPLITYHIQPEKSWIEAPESYWDFAGHQIKLDSFQTPFINRSIQVNRLPLNIDRIVNAELSGTITVDPVKTDLICMINSLDFEDIVLQQPVQLKIKSDKQIKVDVDKSSWDYKGAQIKKAETSFILHEDTLSLPATLISYNDLLDAEVSGNINTQTFEANLQIQPRCINNEILASLIPMDRVLQLNLSRSDTTTTITLPELAVTGAIEEEGKWQLYCGNTVDFMTNNKILASDFIKSGTFTIESGGKDKIDFSANLQLKKAIFQKEGVPVKTLSISGNYTPQKTSVQINQNIFIHLAEKIDIEGKSLAFLIPETLDIIDAFSAHSDTQETENTKTVVARGDDIKLLFDGETTVLSDKLNIDYKNGLLTAHIKHGRGKLDFTSEKDQFSLEGKDLNKKFMEALSPHIRIHKGKMHVAAQGSYDEYSVLVNAHDLIIKDFAPLNNTLAFLDTIPALITFSWPEYSTKGFPVDSVIAGVKAKKGMLTIESFTMDSPVTKMTGTGWADRNTRKMDLDFNMYTKARTSLSKIPLIGYILVGDEKKPSIRLKVSGNMDDPQVEHSAYKDVLTMPFSIIERTIKLPGYLFQ